MKLNDFEYKMKYPASDFGPPPTGGWSTRHALNVFTKTLLNTFWGGGEYKRTKKIVNLVNTGDYEKIC